jgi:hypothetical protein
MAIADNTTNPFAHRTQPCTSAIRAACNAAPQSPGCLYPACDCTELPRAVTGEALGSPRPSLPLSIGQPAGPQISHMIEVDRRREAISICHAIATGPGARVTGALWLPPDEAEALAHALLLAVTDWRADQAATACTTPQGGLSR